MTSAAAYTTIISVADLAAHLDDPNWVVCDCRHDLARYSAGRDAYNASHVRGARFVHLDEDLSGPKTGVNGRHPLPHPATFALRVGALGISNSSQVVAYDDVGGFYAARLWWMLRWLGHSAVAVLDGGWQAWLQAGLRVSSSAPTFEPTTYAARPQNVSNVDTAYVLSHLNDGTIAVVDARSPDRFRGENETLDPRGGHIPGALSRFFKTNLGEDGRFKPAQVLAKEFVELLGSRNPQSVVHQCGSGVTACHNLLAMEHAGLRGSRLYPGSWSEWVSAPERPIER